MRNIPVDDAERSERGSRLAPALFVVGALCAVIAATALPLLQSPSWACAQFFTHETGLPKDVLLFGTFFGSVVVGTVTAAVATVIWWRATPWPAGATAAVRHRLDSRRAWAGRAAVLALSPLAVLVLIVLSAGDLIAHCGD